MPHVPGPSGAPSRRARLVAIDEAIFHRVATTHTPLLDGVLPALSQAANHGVLWWATAAGLGATGGSRRRAALRGLVSLGLASAVANLPAKYAARRTRPTLTHVPLARRLRRQPSTSSFPSGHSASAAAFAVGAGLESPVTGALVGVVAGAVAYSRVYVGVHYPGDVLAGATLGAGCALVTLKIWPRRPDRPAE